MSHVLIVSSSDSEEANLVLRRGIDLFKHFHNVCPSEQASTQSTRLALFPFALAATPSIVRTAHGCLCGVGAWFLEGLSGKEALRRLADQLPTFAQASDSRLNELDGWFAIAGLQDTGDVFILTDRLGELHIYSARIGKCQLVSTSSLVLGTLADSNWDLTGCRQFLATGTIFEPSRTLFESVKKLGPASLYRFSRRGIESKKYWDLNAVLCQRALRPASVSELACALCDAITTIARNHARPVLDLTGGFDTRGILGAALQAGLQLDYTVVGPDNDPDVIASRRIACAFGLRHHHVWKGFDSAADWWDRAKASLALCDGEQDILYYAPVLAVHSMLARTFDATVNGGVGEICQGHWWEVFGLFAGLKCGSVARTIAKRRLIGAGEVRNLLAADFRQDLTELFEQIVRQVNKGVEHQPNTVQMDNAYLALWEQRFYGRTVSATSHLWPTISPYSFRRVLEASVCIPWPARIRRRMSSRLIEYQNADLAAMPTARGYPALPLRLATAHRFWPLVSEFAPLVGRRVVTRLGLAGVAARFSQIGSHSGSPFFKELCALEEVRDMTEPSCMLSRGLYREGRLREVLRSPPVQRHCLTAWPGRVLTLELLARQKSGAARVNQVIPSREGLSS